MNLSARSWWVSHFLLLAWALLVLHSSRSSRAARESSSA
jgi:hypothetical protein